MPDDLEIPSWAGQSAPVQLELPQTQAAKVAVVGAQGSNPEQAAKSIELSNQTGIPAPVVHLDPVTVEAKAQNQQNAAIIDSNPHVANYLQQPMAAQVSHDDLGPMDKFFRSLENMMGYKQREGVVSGAIQGFQEGISPDKPLGISPETLKQYPIFNTLQLPAETLDTAGRLVTGLFGSVIGGAGGAVRALGFDQSAAESLKRDLTAGLIGSMGGGAAIPGRLPQTPTAIDEFLQKAEEFKNGVESESKAVVPSERQPSAKPSSQTRQEIDDFLAKKEAEVHAANLDETIAAAQESKTTQRAPDLAAQAARQVVGDETIGIPVEKIDEVRETNPKAFDYVPDLEDQLARGRADGSEVQIPLADYITRTDPALHDQVKDDIRQLNGLTPAEAKEAPKESATTDVKGAEPIESPGDPIVTEVQRVRRALWLDPLFEKPDVVGMSQSDFAAYSKRIQETQNTITKAVADAAYKEEARRQTSTWKSEDKLLRDQIGQEFQNRPDLLADEYLRKNGLNTDEEVIAEMTGFNSAKEMFDSVNALREARGDTQPAVYRRKLIADEANRRMEAKYGTLEQNILNAAMEHVVDVAQLNVLANEVRALAKEAGLEDQALSRGALEKWADDTFGKLRAKDADNLNRIRRMISKYGLEAERALLAKKPDEAFIAKQKQFLQAQIFKRAKELAKEKAKFERQIRPFTEERVVDSVAQPYTDQVHGLLEQVGIGSPRNPNELGGKLRETPLTKFVADKALKGEIIYEPKLPFSDNGGPKLFDNFTVDEFRDLRDGVASLIHAGKESQSIYIGEKRAAYEDAVAEALGNLSQMKDKFNEDDTSVLARARVGGQYVLAQLVKMERLFDWIDQRDSNGVFNRVVFRPLSEAKSWKDDKIRELGKMLDDLPQRSKKEMREKIPNTKLINENTGRPMPLTRANLISIALNMGSESSRKVLLGGYGWREADVLELLNDPTIFKKEDAETVEGLWKIFARLEPDVMRVTERISGVAVDKVPAQAVPTAHGELKGGYYPLRYNPLDKLNKSANEVDLFQNFQYNPLPSPSAFKHRTGEVYRIDLNLNNVARTLIDTVHGLAFREPIMNASKLLGDRLIREEITNKFGPAFTEQLNPWLRYIANDGGMYDGQADAWVNRALATGRSNWMFFQIGFNWGTPLLHGGSALSNSIGEVGAARFAAASKELGADRLLATMDHLFRNPSQTASLYDWVHEQSGEIRNRSHNIDRDWSAMLDKNLGKINLRKSFAVWGSSMISALDKASAVPTWLAAYQKALEEGMTHEDAVYFGDKTVRNAHGSSGITDLAAIARGNEFKKWWTTFFGYGNHNFNQEWDLVRMAKEEFQKDNTVNPKVVNAAFGRFGQILLKTATYLIIPAAIHQVLRGHTEDKDPWAKTMAQALASQVALGIPGARDVDYAIESHNKVNLVPFGEIFDTVVDPIRDADNYIIGHHVSENWKQHLIEAPGFFGLSSRQMGRTGGFIWDTVDGKQQPRSMSEWMHGLATGKARSKKR